MDPTTQAVTKLPDRVFDMKKGEYVDQPAATGMPSPTTKEEYNKLPKGATYKSPDGKVLIKG